MSNIYIFHSKDPTWIEEEVEKRIARHYKDNPPKVIPFFFPGQGVSDVLQEMQAPSMFEQAKVIHITNYESNAKKSDLDKILANLAKKDLLILSKREIPFASKAFEKMIKGDKRIEVNIEYFPNENRLRNKLKLFLKQQKIKLETAAFEDLVFYFLAHPEHYNKETEKLAHCYGGEMIAEHEKDEDGGVVLTREDIEQVMLTDMSAKEFAIAEYFLEALKNADPKKFFEKTEIYLNEKGELFKLVAIIQNEIEKVLRFCEMRKNRYSDENIFSALGVYYNKGKLALQRRSQNINQAFEKAALGLIDGAYFEIDQSPIAPSMAGMERCFYIH